MEFWDQPEECMERPEIEQLQLERLQTTLNRAYKNVRYYRKSFREIDFMPEDLRSLDELKKLPFTNRQVLMDNYPYGMFAVPLREVVRLHAPALNLDTPLVMGFTRNDLDNCAELMARNLTAVGVDRDDVVQISMTFGIITGPFGVQLGAERIGASVIPMSGGKFPAQVRIMRDFKTTILVSTPTFALRLIQAMESLGLDPAGFSLKRGIFGAEPWSEQTRQELESRLQISATDIYGLNEVFGPGVAYECPKKNGLHLSEDHFIPEIIDPVTLESLEPGISGELVLTAISKEACPLIRFRTGDIARITYSPCACGRTHCRISRIFNRCDDVVVMRGSSILPEQIGKTLCRISGICPNYQLMVERKENEDYLTVLVEISDIFFFDEMKKQRQFVEMLHQHLSELTGWEVSVRLVEAGAFDPKQRVKDMRKFN